MAGSATPGRRNTDRILGLFDAAGVNATFFTLGWVAERHPALVRRIVAAGHELASHGYWHRLAHEQTPADFARDVGDARKLLEDVGGVAVQGYRAPTFSHQHAAIRGPSTCLRKQATATVRASIRYVTICMACRTRRAFHSTRAAAPWWEIPMTTVRLAGRNFPCAGGGYFRLLPYALFSAALRHRGPHRRRTRNVLHPSLGDRSGSAARAHRTAAGARSATVSI
ncbi:MAG: polysaccharide deacetylase family protein [Rhodospirillales bacterium]